MDLIHHLKHSIWTLELQQALEAFSLSSYLNWFDCDFKTRDDFELGLDRDFSYDNFPEEFLHYLEYKVSEPCGQTKFQLQLLILNRENLTFITTICCVTWSMLILPSTISQLERNSGS
jgi:hypothetical protein